MKRLDMKTMDVVKEKKSTLKQLFPNCFSEEEIDFDMLKQELSEFSIDDKKEKYQLTWPGKKEAILECNKTTKSTLRPLENKSSNFEETKNIYIEGDNLEVLKILQESYLNKIDCIYIDPPYNTGSDFIYNDDFSKSSEDELINAGELDEYGNKLISNSRSNGRFHSDWLSMMYPRLKLARNLLSDLGFIFISIDDNELQNLKKICDEIFGDNNFIAQLSWYKGYGKNESHFYSNNMEYVLVYCKNFDFVNSDEENYFFIEKEGYNEVTKLLYDCKENGIGVEETQKRVRDFYKVNNYKGIAAYNNVDNNYKLWRSVSMEKPKDPCYFYDIIHPITNKPCKKPKKGWRMPEKTMKEYLNNDLIVFGIDENTIPNRKNFLEDMRYETPKNFIDNSSQGGNDILSIFDGTAVFDYPKSISVMQDILRPLLNKKENATVLDFFSGSATTANLVMLLNSKDNGNRKYIMVQLPELCNEKSEAYKAGYKTICDIGEDRIRRANKKIKEETNANIDYGFRVYYVDSSNMKDVFYKPGEIGQMNLMEYLSNIKEDRNPKDLLIQVMLDLGLTLDLKIEEKQLKNNKVFYVSDNALVACFDDDVDIEIIDTICECKPLKVVFKDVSFKADKDKINLEERVKKLSPETEISIL